jgi:hypothetical protein
MADRELEYLALVLKKQADARLVTLTERQSARTQLHDRWAARTVSHELAGRKTARRFRTGRADVPS